MQFSPKFLGVLLHRLKLKSASVAQDYIREYKKYLMMIACSHKMNTPSEQVDLVWHLH